MNCRSFFAGGILPVVLVLSTSAGELLNPGFEAFEGDKPVGWEIPEGGAWKVEDNAGVNGMHALSFDAARGAAKGIPGQWIEIDRSKAYRFECWVRTEGLEGPKNPGASICIECVDKDGKVFYGKYSGYAVGGTQKEWMKIDDLTGPGQFPPRAVKLRIEPIIRNGTDCRGKAWFDNVLLVPYDESKAKVPGLYSSAYRNVAADGKVTFFAPLHLPSNGTFKAEFEYAAADGTSRRVAADRLRAEGTWKTLSVADLAKGASAAKVTVRDEKGVVVGEAACPFNRVDELPKRRVYVDRYNRTIVDGKPFFPLGMYISHAKDEMLEKYAKGPFNCTLCYWHPYREDLERCRKYNLMLIGSLYKAYVGVRTSWAKTKEKEMELVARTVADCKDHPNLLAWYINDEYPATMIPRLTERRDLLEKLDPDHPVCSCVCQVNEIGDFLPSFDVVSSDPYPIGYPHREVPVSMAADWTRKTRKGSFGFRAMWQTPQAFSWKDYQGGQVKHGGFPTEEEYLNMSCQCIAEGANGLVAYSFGQILKTYKDPAEYEEIFGRICRSWCKLKANLDTFLSVEPAPKAKVVAPADGTGCVRTWRKDGKVWVLAVNASHQPQQVKVALSAPVTSVGESAFGEKPTLADGGKTLVYDFPALGCSLVAFDL